jgi:hypothetical protein
MFSLLLGEQLKRLGMIRAPAATTEVDFKKSLRDTLFIF